MSEKPDGGPAFPKIDVEHFQKGYGHGEHCEAESKAGMSLRDYFAGQALSGLIHHYQSDEAIGYDPIPDLAKVSYEYADAMLARRAK